MQEVQDWQHVVELVAVHIIIPRDRGQCTFRVERIRCGRVLERVRAGSYIDNDDIFQVAPKTGEIFDKDAVIENAVLAEQAITRALLLI